MRRSRASHSVSQSGRLTVLAGAAAEARGRREAGRGGGDTSLPAARALGSEYIADMLCLCEGRGPAF